jgi:hypothetical protein
LALQQMSKEGFEFGIFHVSLAPCLAEPIAEVFEDKINVMIIAWRHDRGGLFGSTHDATRYHDGPECPRSAGATAQYEIENQCLISGGSLPPFAASLIITSLCSQMFMLAESFLSPV